MGDPHATRRNPAKQSKVERAVLNKARRAVRSRRGKALLRKKGEHLERSFCHVLDHGVLRRATLRGVENLTKRQLGAHPGLNGTKLSSLAGRFSIGGSAVWDLAKDLSRCG